MRATAVAVVALMFALCACGDDDNGLTQSDRLGVGAQCSSNDDCLREGDGGINLACLPQFKGGYCGLEDCNDNDDCPERSACVAHEDGQRYCFRSCADKPECNVNRSADNEANCSANVEYVEQDTPGKSCVPPSN
jgi:hypothetical protein